MNNKKELFHLRRTQFIYTNLFFLGYTATFISFIFLNATRKEVYLFLGISLFIFAIFSQLLKKGNPILSYSLKMRKLDQWEREKLGSSWHKYHFTGTLLQSILGIYFLLQALLFHGAISFKSGIPIWYIISVPMVLILVLNLNLKFHVKRVDTKTTEELAFYSKEKMMFTLIFAIVSSVMTLIGFILVLLMR